MLKSIVLLLKKDFLLEFRQQHILYGVLLYVASTIFVVYLSMGQPEEKTWIALFWIVLLFVCVNAVAKSFLTEGRGKMLYFYTVVSPQAFVLSKLIFNALQMLCMSLLSLALFAVLLDNPLEDMGTFIGITFLASTGLSLTFTFLAAIAAKAQQQASLMAIMGFPIIIPQLLLVHRITTLAFAPINTGLWQLIAVLLVLDLLIVVLAIILFPFLWRD